MNALAGPEAGRVLPYFSGAIERAGALGARAVYMVSPDIRLTDDADYGRAMARLADAAGRIDSCPLGACAMAGTAFPIDRPRYALIVVVDEPKGNKESFGYATGGWVAAPVVARVIARMAPLVGILPVQPGRPAPKGGPLITAQLRGG